MPDKAQLDAALKTALNHFRGRLQRRLFMATVAVLTCGGNARKTERRFGWGRVAVGKGLLELLSGKCQKDMPGKGRLKAEDVDPRLAGAIHAVAEPHRWTDRKLRAGTYYLALSANQVLQLLQQHSGYRPEDLPRVRTMRDVLHRLGYRMRRRQRRRADGCEVNVTIINVQPPATTLRPVPVDVAARPMPESVAGAKALTAGQGQAAGQPLQPPGRFLELPASPQGHAEAPASPVPAEPQIDHLPNGQGGRVVTPARPYATDEGDDLARPS